MTISNDDDSAHHTILVFDSALRNSAPLDSTTLDIDSIVRNNTHSNDNIDQTPVDSEFTSLTTLHTGIKERNISALSVNPKQKQLHQDKSQ